MSEHFLKQNVFLTCSWRVLRSNRLKKKYNSNWRKILGFRNMQKKLEKSSFLNVKVEKIKWTLSCVTYVALKNSFYFCREVVLGEHVV